MGGKVSNQPLPGAGQHLWIFSLVLIRKLLQRYRPQSQELKHSLVLFGGILEEFLAAHEENLLTRKSLSPSEQLVDVYTSRHVRIMSVGKAMIRLVDRHSGEFAVHAHWLCFQSIFEGKALLP